MWFPHLLRHVPSYVQFTIIKWENTFKINEKINLKVIVLVTLLLTRSNKGEGVSFWLLGGGLSQPQDRSHGGWSLKELLTLPPPPLESLSTFSILKTESWPINVRPTEGISPFISYPFTWHMQYNHILKSLLPRVFNLDWGSLKKSKRKTRVGQPAHAMPVKACALFHIGISHCLSISTHPSWPALPH